MSPVAALVEVGPGCAGIFGWFLLVVFSITAGVYMVTSFRRVPVGAAGVVITLGRRSGETLPEGVIWLPRILKELRIIYVRERQIDVPEAEYYTEDRARLSFKTTLRVRVSNPAALFDQGPGTFAPFARDAVSGTDSGSEEANVPMQRLVQNSIREVVSSLQIRDVMFGGRATGVLQTRIQEKLMRTASRWGLEVLEVWLTEIDADDDELKRAVQSEVRASMQGRGDLAAHEAEVAKSGLFFKVAGDLVEDARVRLGREIPVEEAVRFLMSSYRDERSLDVALEAASGKSDLAQLFYLRHLGLPLPGVAPAPERAMLSHAAADGRNALPEGAWVLGREGDLVLDWDGVSRYHARVEVRNGQILLTDLSSTNGTFVNGQRLTPEVPTRVRPEDEVRFGQRVTRSGEELVAGLRKATTL